MADSADPAEAAYRAAIVASQMVGLALARYVLAFEPVAAASVDDLAATIGPTVDRYLTGDIRPPRDAGHQSRGKAARSGGTQPVRAAWEASVADA